MNDFKKGDVVIVDRDDDNYLKRANVLTNGSGGLYRIEFLDGVRASYRDRHLREVPSSKKTPVKGDWVYGLHHGKPIVGILDFYDHRFPCPYVLEGEGSCVSVRAATEKEILEEKKRRGETEVEKPSDYDWVRDAPDYKDAYNAVYGSKEKEFELKVGDKVVAYSRIRASVSDECIGKVVDKAKFSDRYCVRFDDGQEVYFARMDLKRIPETKPIPNYKWFVNDEVVRLSKQPPCGYHDYSNMFSSLGLKWEGPLIPSLFRSTPRTEVLTKIKTKKKLNLKFRTK